MTVKQGDTVSVHYANRPANGSDVHVGIVTAAFSQPAGKPLVNVKVLPDLNGFYDLSSVGHRDDRVDGAAPNAPYWFEREDRPWT